MCKFKPSYLVHAAICALEFYLPILFAGQSLRLATFVPLNIAFFYPLLALVLGLIFGRRDGFSFVGVMTAAAVALPALVLGLAGIAAFAAVTPLRFAIYYLLGMFGFSIGKKGWLHDQKALENRPESPFGTRR